MLRTCELEPAVEGRPQTIRQPPQDGGLHARTKMNPDA